jgi:hypothetical protein
MSTPSSELKLHVSSKRGCHSPADQNGNIQRSENLTTYISVLVLGSHSGD